MATVYLARDVRHDRDLAIKVSVREAQQVTFGTEKIEKLAISRDGRLAYHSDRNGQADIWKVPLVGGTPEQVTHGPNNKFVNDWSPDGQEIVYHSMREGGQRDVLVVLQSLRRAAADEHLGGVGRRRGAALARRVRRSHPAIVEARVRH